MMLEAAKIGMGAAVAPPLLVEHKVSQAASGATRRSATPNPGSRRRGGRRHAVRAHAFSALASGNTSL